MLDFLPRPLITNTTGLIHQKPLLPWLIRRVECVRGSLSINVECAPAFNYARNAHVTTIVDDHTVLLPKHKKGLFESADLTLDLRYIAETTTEDVDVPVVRLTTLDLSAKGHKGLAIQAFVHLIEGQAVTFILRNPPVSADANSVSALANKAQQSLSPEILQAVDAAIVTADPNRAIVSRRLLDDPMLTKVCTFLIDLRPKLRILHSLGCRSSSTHYFT